MQKKDIRHKKEKEKIVVEVQYKKGGSFIQVWNLPIYIMEKDPQIIAARLSDGTTWEKKGKHAGEKEGKG